MNPKTAASQSAAHRVTRLLAVAKDGNTVARDELVESVFHRLNRLCQKLRSQFPGVAAYEQTGDVMGEVWPKLLKELARKEFENSAHFFSFSAVLIRNVLIDLLRKHYGRNGRGAREAFLDMNWEGQTAENLRDAVLEGKDTNTSDRQAMRAEIHSVIHRLPPSHQEMFNLRFYHGLKERECAEILGVDVRTVRRRWRNARLTLAEALSR